MMVFVTPEHRPYHHTTHDARHMLRSGGTLVRPPGLSLPGLTPNHFGGLEGLLHARNKRSNCGRIG